MFNTELYIIILVCFGLMDICLSLRYKNVQSECISFPDRTKKRLCIQVDIRLFYLDNDRMCHISTPSKNIFILNTSVYSTHVALINFINDFVEFTAHYGNIVNRSNFGKFVKGQRHVTLLNTAMSKYIRVQSINIFTW